MPDINFDVVFIAIFIFGILVVGVIWGGVELYQLTVTEFIYTVEQPITPEIQLIINNNQVDTLYVYRFPK